jgi:hypothetical protein
VSSAKSGAESARSTTRSFGEAGGQTPRLRAGASSYEGFQAWAGSHACPERGCVSYLDGDVWIDFSPEEIETHNQVRSAVGLLLGDLGADGEPGVFYPRGVQFAADAARLAAVPDGLFVRWESFTSGRVQLAPHPDVLVEQVKAGRAIHLDSLG